MKLPNLHQVKIPSLGAQSVLQHCDKNCVGAALYVLACYS